MIRHILSMTGLTIMLSYLIIAYILTRDITIFVGVMIVTFLLLLVFINLKTEMKKTK